MSGIHSYLHRIRNKVWSCIYSKKNIQRWPLNRLKLCIYYKNLFWQTCSECSSGRGGASRDDITRHRFLGSHASMPHRGPPNRDASMQRLISAPLVSWQHTVFCELSVVSLPRCLLLIYLDPSPFVYSTQCQGLLICSAKIRIGGFGLSGSLR